MASPQVVSFETVTRVTPVSSHQYKASIHLDYSFGTRAHGGFLNALILLATSKHFSTTLAHTNQSETVSFHVEYLRPAMVGEVLLTVRDTKIGKASSTIHINLCQDGKVRAEAYATNVNPKANAAGTTLSTGYDLVSQQTLPPIDFSKILENRDPHWIRFEYRYESFEMSRHLTKITYALPKQLCPDQSFTQRWISPSRAEERWTTSLLGVVVDHDKPTPENMIAGAPWADERIVRQALRRLEEGKKPVLPMAMPQRVYSTSNTSLDIVRPLPPEGMKWLPLRSRTKAVRNGRWDLHVEVWDMEGKLVALSQQLWTVIDISRMGQASAMTVP